jgi:hypothetical protein
MGDMLNNLQPFQKEICVVYSTGLVITALSAIYFGIIGYPLVNKAFETLNIKTPPLYMISIFLPYGILIGEVLWLFIGKKERNLYILLCCECIFVGIFSFVRYIITIPFSGHTIILFFYLLHQASNNKFRYSFRILIGAVVLIITILYKIIFWNDPFTFLLGALLGTAIWIPGYLYRVIKARK